MAAEEGSIYSKAYPMNGGNGIYSYTKNSTGQKETADAAMLLIKEGIAQQLDLTILSPSNAFRIADLGCSVGPNTFFAVQNIIEAVETKYQSQGLDNPEFHVFFNDHAMNDFNTLFKSLPTERRYYAAGVPGSFHGRLFPDASLHFVYSSCALHWLSKVPKQVVNKGRIYYSNAGEEVSMGYSNQHGDGMDRFLEGRAVEVVCGGLMVLIIPARPNDTPHSQVQLNIVLDTLGVCLMDMANKKIIDEEKVDSFNLPIYIASPQEVEAAINRNGCFSIEGMESMPQMTVPQDISVKAQFISMLIRASVEGLIKEVIGSHNIDHFFHLYTHKLEEAFSQISFAHIIALFVLLRRKPITCLHT